MVFFHTTNYVRKPCKILPVSSPLNPSSVNGSTLSSTTNTITFSVANGTYSYSVASVSGYTVSPASGSITVNGKNISQSITFTSSSTTTTTKPSSSGISSTELYAIMGAVVAVAVIGSAIAVTRRK